MLWLKTQFENLYKISFWPYKLTLLFKASCINILTQKNRKIYFSQPLIGFSGKKIIVWLKDIPKYLL
jgi:hypothetical protein